MSLLQPIKNFKKSHRPKDLPGLVNRSAPESQKPRQKTFTVQQDEVIRRTYLEGGSTVKELSKRWGISAVWIKHRAAQLGVNRPRSVWLKSEIAILEAYAHLPAVEISRRLKKQDFDRTPNAVKLKLSRLLIRRRIEGDFYSVRGLASCFGVTGSTVATWIRMGFLEAKVFEGSTETGKRYAISDAMVRKFIVSHRMKYDLRRVDQIWFLGFVLPEGETR